MKTNGEMRRSLLILYADLEAKNETYKRNNLLPLGPGDISRWIALWSLFWKYTNTLYTNYNSFYVSIKLYSQTFTGIIISF